MIIALLSDTHNNQSGVIDALKILKDQKIETIIHCGDMTNSETAELFQDFCIHHVRGNGDIDWIGIQFAVESCQPGSSSDSIYTDLIDGKRIAALHGNDQNLYYGLLEKGAFDYVFVGHTHSHRDERIGGTRVINPGAVGGAFRGKRGFCTLNLLTDDLVFYAL